MSSEIARLLSDLARMRGADRAAILAQLTPRERELLTAHAAATVKSTPRLTENGREAPLPACSPWLAKRMSTLLDAPNPAVTEMARDAVRGAVTHLADAKAS